MGKTTRTLNYNALVGALFVSEVVGSKKVERAYWLDRLRAEEGVAFRFSKFRSAGETAHTEYSVVVFPSSPTNGAHKCNCNWHTKGRGRSEKQCVHVAALLKLVAEKKLA